MTRHAEAERILQNYINQFPFSETTWFEMGQFYFNQKKLRKTIQSFDYLFAINSDAAGFMPIKQRVMKRWNNGEKRLRFMRRTAELEYTKAFTFTKLDYCYKAAKNMEALRAFQKSLKKIP